MIMLIIFLFMLSAAVSPQIPMLGAKHAVELCLYAVIPSLFPFFILNYILLKSGAITNFCNRYLKHFTKVFKLPPASASAVILGFLSGYPAGTKAAGELYENKILSAEEYRHLTAFCSNAGPVFITGTVGIGMLGSEKYGFLLFAVHIISAAAVGIIFSFFRKDAGSKTSGVRFANNRSRPLTQLFTEGVYDSLKSVSAICGYVIFFGMITAYISNYTVNVPPVAKGIITGFTEMTNGTAMLASLNLPARTKLALISGIIGWGGLCVHAQSFCFLKAKKSYLAGKAMQGILSFAVTYLVF